MDLPRDYLENSPSSQLISTALAAIVEFETARRKERQRQGIEAAKVLTMKNSFKREKELVPINKVKVTLGESICKITISGYSLDSDETFNPEAYTILCHLGEVSDGLRYFPKASKWSAE